jgi:hypothetical protein
VKNLVGLVMLVLMPWCTVAASMSKPQHEQYFVLEKDRTRAEVHGLKHVTWIVGLRAGTYKLVGEDHDGLYFQGEGDCALILVGEHAERYLQTGEIVPFEERKKIVLPAMTGGYGGIWLPKEGINKEAMLYWPLHVETDSFKNNPLNGLVTLGIVELINRSLAHHYLGKDLSFLGDLNIISVP